MLFLGVVRPEEVVVASDTLLRGDVVAFGDTCRHVLLHQVEMGCITETLLVVLAATSVAMCYVVVHGVLLCFVCLLFLYRVFKPHTFGFHAQPRLAAPEGGVGMERLARPQHVFNLVNGEAVVFDNLRSVAEINPLPVGENARDRLVVLCYSHGLLF